MKKIGPTGDEARDEWLQLPGFTVLRFWNNEALSNLAGVLERIATYPSRSPLPLGEAACT